MASGRRVPASPQLPLSSRPRRPIPLSPRLFGPGSRRLFVLSLLALAGPFLLAGWILSIDPRGGLAAAASPATVSIYDRRGTLLYEALDPDRGKASFVPLREISPHLLHATVATEDASFYANPGVDPLAVLRAAVQNWRSEGIVSGGSTLTQQLARNLYMSAEERREPTLGRKMREALLALRLSVRLDKDEILERYLNSAPYGHQAVGAEAAARVYFGKSARDLDLAESALLAGLPQAPSAYDPLVDPEKAEVRRQVVLSLMVKQGYVSETEAQAAAAEPLYLTTVAFPVRAPHFVAYVRQLVADELGLDPTRIGGMRVYTSLDSGLQQIAEATVCRQVAALADRNVTNGALVALDPATGQILAMVGSADYFDPAIDGEVNVALAPRQPGSSLKPFLYGAALTGGLTAATVLYDVPTSFLTADGKSYAPENYDRLWHGPVSVREALANSYNLPAVVVLQRVGLDSFLDVATRVGLPSLATKGSGDLSLALGSGEVRLLDLVSAYSSLAGDGVARGPLAILRVEDTNGRVLYQASAGQERRVFSPRVAYLLTSILSDDEARAASFGRGGPLHLGRPAAAKSGTTTDWRDNWTVGYTPDLVAGVWVGNSDNTPMQGVSGVSGAGPIWHDFMEEALKARPVVGFREPPGLVRAQVCPESGDLPSPWCPNRRVELFVEGTVPTATDTWYRSFPIDRASGLPPEPGTPADQVEERVYLVLPPELEQWGRERGIPEPPPGAQLADGIADAATLVERTSGAAGGRGSRPSRPVVPFPAGAGWGEGRTPSVPRLLLVSPAPGTVLEISPEVPLALQRLEVAAAGSGLGQRPKVELRVDGESAAAFDSPPFRATWQLSAGRHLFQAVSVDPTGTVVASDEAEITVEAGPAGP